MTTKFADDLYYFSKNEFELAIQKGNHLLKLHPGSRYEVLYQSDIDQIELWIEVHSNYNDFEKLFGPGDVPGYLNQGDIDAIAFLVSKLPNTGKIVELGSFVGKSAVEWAKNFENQNKKYDILCLDSFNVKIDFLKKLIKEAEFDVPDCDSQKSMFNYYTKKYPNIKALEVHYDMNFVFPSEDIQMFFDDSDHSQKNLAYRLPFWYEKIASGGILAGANYVKHEVKVAVDMFAMENNLELNTFDNDSTIYYMIKP